MRCWLTVAVLLALTAGCQEPDDSTDHEAPPGTKAKAAIDYCELRALNPFEETAQEFAASLGPSGAYPAVKAPVENAPTPEKAILGKILFWDEQLSSDDTVACGTCHRAASGGSDPRSAELSSRHPGADGLFGTPDDVRGSRGIARCTIDDDGIVTPKEDPVFGFHPQVTKRKPPSYLDAMVSSSLFWDGRATDQFVDPDDGSVAIATGGALESQAVGPPVSNVEMACEGRTWADIHAKLARVKPLAFATDVTPDIAAALCENPSYPALFQAAFGTPEINTSRIAFAIATHERRLLSNQTSYDRFAAGDTSALSVAQQDGNSLVQAGAGRCFNCHLSEVFDGSTFVNLGFVRADFDTGRQAITALAGDRGRFRVPSMRNAALREAGGLTHDGVSGGATLEEHIAKYNEPPDLDGNTDDKMKLGLNLTPTQMSHIVDFIRNGLTDPRVEAEIYPFDHPKLSSDR
jgi:cytochrome c peroxidase